MLRLTLQLSGHNTRVELDGVDISRYLCALSVDTKAGGLSTATLHYRGAMIVDVEGGHVALVQAPLYVTCAQCGATQRGAPAEPIVVTVERFGDVVEELPIPSSDPPAED